MTPTLQLAAPEAEAAQDQQPEDFGPNNRNLPDSLKKAITEAVKRAQEEDKYARRIEVMQDAKNRFYDLGIQHIYCANQQSGYTQATPGTSLTLQGGEQIDFPDYIDDYNIFHAFALIPQAKLSENAPGVDFQPVDPNAPDDESAAKAGENMRHEFDRNNDRKTLEKQTVYHLEMSGRVVRWTHTVDSYERYGTNQDGTPRRHSTAENFGALETKLPIFAACVREFPYAIIYKDTEVKIAKHRYPWLKSKIRSGGTCLAENTYERIARLSLMQSGSYMQQRMDVGDAAPHVVTTGHVWLRHASFIDADTIYVGPDGQQEMMEDEEQPEDAAEGSEPSMRPMKIYDKIVEVFPKGVQATIVGDEYAESQDQSMDDCIGVGHANITAGQTPMPLMKSMVVVQDRFNSTMNFIAECFDYGAPSINVGCDATEFAAFSKQHASPYAYRNMKNLAPGEKMQDKIYREEQPEVSESQQKYMEFLSAQFPQFLLAVPPSIWGAAMKDQKTAAGYHMAASQAMGVLGTYWSVMGQLDATMYYHNCLAIMDDPKYPEQITVTGQGGQNVTVSITSLRRGNFRCYPDTDSGFPESTADKRATMTQILTQLENTPLGAQVMGSPDNISEMFRVFGIPELVIPEAESRNKQMREIETLLKASPIVGDEVAAAMAAGADLPMLLNLIKGLIQQGMAGAQMAMQNHAAAVIAARSMDVMEPPAPPTFDHSTVAKSSVAVIPSDYHVWEAKKTQDWLSSAACNNELKIGRNSGDAQAGADMTPNVPGVLNVFLHWQEHMVEAAAQAPPISGPLPAPNIKPPGVAAPPSGPPTAQQ